jgi:hypothetical protein
MQADRLLSSRFLCHITLSPPRLLFGTDLTASVSFSRLVASTLREDSVQFVYSDVVLEYAEQVDALLRWTQVLAKGGLVVGSQYASQQSVHPSDFPWNSASPLEVGESFRLTSGIAGAVIEVQPVVPQAEKATCGTQSRNHARLAANSLTKNLSQSVLVTYGEREPHLCSAFAQARRSLAAEWTDAEAAAAYECAPAWYLFKQRTQFLGTLLI